MLSLFRYQLLDLVIFRYKNAARHLENGHVATMPDLELRMEREDTRLAKLEGINVAIAMNGSQTSGVGVNVLEATKRYQTP